MAGFNDRDINEAKRRVLEMQGKASRFVENDKKEEQHTDISHSCEQKEQEEQKDFHGSDDDSKSFFILLALIMLLSKENADNTLILALLYLLL